MTSTRILARRLGRIERNDMLAFNAFLRGLSSADSRTWYVGVLETLAAHGLIDAPPANLWEQPQPVKDAYVAMLIERTGGGNKRMHMVIRYMWLQWVREHERYAV